MRKQLIDAGFAEVIQRGARSRPGILKIWPNGDAPRYVPRERARTGERVRPVRERTSGGALSPKDVMKFTEYIRMCKEAWRVESRRAVEDEFTDVAATINKLGFDRVRQYLDRVAGVSGSDGWRRHLRISSARRSSSLRDRDRGSLAERVPYRVRRRKNSKPRQQYDRESTSHVSGFRSLGTPTSGPAVGEHEIEEVAS